MPFRREASFFRRRLMPDSVWSARKSDTAIVDDGRIVHDRFIHIRVVNDRPVHAHDRGVISKVAATPFTAGEADAHVSETIVHAAIVANVRSPIACMEEVVSAFKSPVRRRPQETWFRSWHPGARNPVITIVAIGPVARSPQIPVFGARWLLIDRQHRRSDTDADDHPGK